MKVIWSEQALVRLIEVQDFIARANPAAAEQLIQRIVERGDGLAKFPEMGRTVPELSRDWRPRDHRGALQDRLQDSGEGRSGAHGF